jgi:regulator of replication initiation timing
MLDLKKIGFEEIERLKKSNEYLSEELRRIRRENYKLRKALEEEKKKNEVYMG